MQFVFINWISDCFYTTNHKGDEQQNYQEKIVSVVNM